MLIASKSLHSLCFRCFGNQHARVQGGPLGAVHVYNGTHAAVYILEGGPSIVHQEINDSERGRR